MRGFEVQAVGIASISYDDESKELINMRNKGAMLGDPSVREGYVQGSIARGLEAAGSNQAGSAATFMGMGIGMQAGGGYMGTASQANVQQMQQQQQMPQTQQVQPAQPAAPPIAVVQQQQQSQQSQPPQGQADNGQWTCSCGVANSGKFCPNCGSKRPERVKCANCGHEIDGAKPKFCPECGTPFA
jgi:membrane protease subunit (stomatin/prohibitin family)